MTKKIALFFDRDGTIIYDVGYPKDTEQVHLLPGAGEALMTLKRKGILLMLVSNQSGIGRGFITDNQAEEVHQTVVDYLAEYGVSVDGVYYCPHAPEDMCECRKPSPKMLFRAAMEHNVDLPSSFMVGDRISDIEAGKGAGCQTIFIKHAQTTDPSEMIADCTVKSWQEIVDYVLDNIRQRILNNSIT